MAANTLQSPVLGPGSRLRGVVNTQVGGLADSANKVFSGVVDTSFGVLRGLLTPDRPITPAEPDVQSKAPWNGQRPIAARKGSGFTIPGVPGVLPSPFKARKQQTGEEGQQMIEVSSRPGSVYVDSDNEKEDDEDTKSIRTFSSRERKTRMSLSDRLANVGRSSSPPPRESLPKVNIFLCNTFFI